VFPQLQAQPSAIKVNIATVRYAVRGLAIAYNIPPAAGPVIEAICQDVEFQAAALE